MDVGAFGCVALVFVVVVLVIAVIGVVAFRAERARRDRIRQWATQNGWSVTYRPKVDWWAQLPGHNRRGFTMLVAGTVAGSSVAVADYSYTEESMADSSGHRSSWTHHYIVTAVRLDKSYPPITVQSRGALSSLGRSLFGDNAAATGNEPFDKQFRVRTKQPALSHTLLGPALMAEHLAGRVPAWSISGSDLLTWQSGTIKDPAQIPHLAGALVRVAQLLGR
jgi:hypothetical protein